MQEGKIFSIFGANGTMEELKGLPQLPLYCKVYSYGAGMSECEGAVISGPNQYGAYTCVSLSNYDTRFFTIDKYSRPHSKKFGIGTYYDDALTIQDEAEVKEFIIKAEAEIVAQKTAAEAKAASDKKEREELPAKYPYLTVNTQDDNKITKANIVSALKHNFPTVKFSVRKRHHSSYEVEWTDGSSYDSVKSIVGKFVDHHMDITGDYNDYDPSNFNRVFGGFSYIFCERNKSEEVKNLLPALNKLNPNTHNIHENPDLLHRIFSKTSFPAGAIITGVEAKKNFTGSFDDAFQITYDMPEDEIIEDGEATAAALMAPAQPGTAIAEIRHNKEKNGIEIKFPGRPTDDILEQVKVNNVFRWSKFAKVWYAKVSTQAKQIAMQFGSLPSSLS